MGSSRRSRLPSLALALLLLLPLASCSGDDTASNEVALRVVIPDGNIRPEGTECAGARPYRHVRPGVPFTVQSTDEDGEVLAEGVLPAGVAENADPSIDWEELERIPTVCIMELAFEDLPERDGYELVIEGVNPMAFSAADVAVGTPIVLILAN